MPLPTARSANMPAFRGAHLEPEPPANAAASTQLHAMPEPFEGNEPERVAMPPIQDASSPAMPAAADHQLDDEEEDDDLPRLEHITLDEEDEDEDNEQEQNDRHNDDQDQDQDPDHDPEPDTEGKMLAGIRQPRPFTPRHISDSGVSYLHPSHTKPPRTRSPYPRPTLRQHGTFTAPPMTRAHSSPTFASPQYMFPPSARSQSPLRSPKRVRSPFRPTLEEPYPISAVGSSLAITDIESISEDHELDITPRPVAPIRLEPSPILASLQYGNTFPRARRRPASPLHQMSNALSTPTSLLSAAATPTSASHSPLFSSARFNEAFPAELGSYPRSFSSSSAASAHSVSVPSTPTSTRSRSPSISSLETIPDTPDAEEAAIEAERVEGLRRPAPGADGSADSLRRGSFDSDRGRSGGFGGRGDKRKRWSVCGAEKRSDLNLETIWED